ncbi:MAG: response regulator [Desulfobacterium sp.]|nr:response regulator [Desulfobacterium sp.]
MLLALLIISILLQFVAAGLAFLLIRKTGRIAAWLLISSALLLMACRRSISLINTLTSDSIIIDSSAEGVALLISCLMVTGVWLIGGVFDRLNNLRAATQCELDKRIKAEEELSKKELLLQEMGRIAKIGAWELDSASGEGTWTDEVARIRDLDPSDKRTMEKGLSFYQGESRAKIDRALQEAIESLKPYELELELVSAKGVHKWVRTIGSPIVEDGKVVGVRGSIQDITKERSLEAQLGQAQKMESVGRLAGGVAHDFNNMLSVILGYAELAMEKLKPDEPLFENLNEIYKAGKRSTDIVRQLLAFASKQTISPKVLDLNDAIESMLKMLRRLIGEDIDVAWLPDADIWPVKVDPSQLNQLLANLCVNARDAMKGVGKITIETKNKIFDEAYCAIHTGFVPGKFVLLAVSDNGHGMIPEVMETIFEPFFTTKDQNRGTGLGLSTVYGIVKQNNGFINVYSEPDEGTTFKIYLPRHKGMDVEADREVAQELSLSQGETVLLVEDDTSILKICEIMLKTMGYNVLPANTVDEAIELTKKNANKIKLLITDVVMPEMNGRELSEQVKKRCPDIKVLFMSGYTADVIAHRGVLEQGVQFIAKPFSREELAKKLRETLDNG